MEFKPAHIVVVDSLVQNDYEVSLFAILGLLSHFLKLHYKLTPNVLNDCVNQRTYFILKIRRMKSKRCVHVWGRVKGIIHTHMQSFRKLICLIIYLQYIKWYILNKTL